MNFRKNFLETHEAKSNYELMKKLIAIIAVLIVNAAALANTPTITQTKSTVLYAETARDVMEALASAGLKVHNLDQDWTEVTLNIKAKNLTCIKSKTIFPDDWASATICDADSTELKNPITLMKTLKPYAATRSTLEEELLEVKSAECYLTTPKDPDEWKTYMCVLETHE